MKLGKMLFVPIFSLFIALYSLDVYGQGRGNDLAFQGVTNPDVVAGVKARAMGSAYTAVSGDINTIFYNPAGLAGIKGLQLSISNRNNYAKTFERQQFIPGSCSIMELIWSGIYTPQLEDDGIRSDKIKYNREHFTEPDSAVDYFDEDFADWVEKNNRSGLNNLTLALPFNILNRKFVASVSYANTAVYDFDRNEHVLGVDYAPGRVVSDSNWTIYNRKRNGELNTCIGALAAKINDNFDVGLSFEYMSGKTDDDLSNEIFAHFQITQQQNENRPLPTNTYYFWHDSLTNGISGKSQFSSLKIGAGLLYKSDKMTFGVRINLPYTLKRTYDYQKYIITKSLRDSTIAPVTEYGSLVKGTSKFKAPFSFGLGITLKPRDFVILALDYKINPFSKGSYDFTSENPVSSSAYNWNLWTLPDLNSLHVGLELIPFKYISLLGGYTNQTEAIRAQDHFKADEEIGVKTDIYSIGISVKIPYVILDFAYSWNNLKYIDYHSFHTDYITWKNENFLASITVIL